jgi:putative NADPH-quinone reductase
VSRRCDTAADELRVDPTEGQTACTAADREKNHFGDPLDHIWRRCILDFCGVTHVNRALFGVVATISADERRAWLEQAGKMARETRELAL